jgi:protocatechuate 3,4-dioxygenase beta subunit
MTRRTALSLFGAASAAVMAACSSSSGDSGAGGSSGSTGGSTGSGGSTTGGGGAAGSDGGSTSCALTPEETAGPYPDKVDLINQPAFFRTDVTEGKTGVPLTLTLTIVNANDSCAPVSGATVEIWHCDKDGVYSEYAGQPAQTDQSGTTYLRGLQKSDANGQLSFTTIYPGWYLPRATHIHIEVFVGGTLVKTTQMAFPDATNSAVYATALYIKGQNSTTNATDMVFSDGDNYQLATITGETTTGLTAKLTVGIAA